MSIALKKSCLIPPMFVCLGVLTHAKGSMGHLLAKGKIVLFLSKGLTNDSVCFKYSSEGSNETETSAPLD